MARQPNPTPDPDLKDLEIAYLRDVINEAAQSRHNRQLADLCLDVARILNGRPA